MLKVSTLILLLCLAFCSGAGAGDFDYAASSQIQSICIDLKTGKDIPCDSLKNYHVLANDPKGELLCPDGKWEQSEYYLIRRKRHYSIEDVQVPNDPSSKEAGNVEVCSSSGLLRIKPNGGKR